MAQSAIARGMPADQWRTAASIPLGALGGQHIIIKMRDQHPPRLHITQRIKGSNQPPGRRWSNGAFEECR